MKRCFKCGIEKDIAEFYRHPRMADGHLGKCKECTKRDVAAHYRDALEKIIAYERARQQTEHRRAKQRQYGRARARRSPEKNRARLITKRAVLRGLIARLPCAVCGQTGAVEAHHTDYSKPLDVVWLCHSHHKQVHGCNSWPPPAAGGIESHWHPHHALRSA